MKNNYEKAIDRLDPTAPDYWKRRMVLQVKSFKYENSRTKMNEYDMKNNLFSIIEEAIENNIKTNECFFDKFVEIKNLDIADANSFQTHTTRGRRSRHIVYDDLCTIDEDAINVAMQGFKQRELSKGEL